jgi:hypothetical protein
LTGLSEQHREGESGAGLEVLLGGSKCSFADLVPLAFTGCVNGTMLQGIDAYENSSGRRSVLG